MLIVAWREMTSGDSGVSLVMSSDARSWKERGGKRGGVGGVARRAARRGAAAVVRARARPSDMVRTVRGAVDGGAAASIEAAHRPAAARAATAARGRHPGRASLGAPLRHATRTCSRRPAPRLAMAGERGGRAWEAGSGRLSFSVGRCGRHGVRPPWCGGGGTGEGVGTARAVGAASLSSRRGGRRWLPTPPLSLSIMGQDYCARKAAKKRRKAGDDSERPTGKADRPKRGRTGPRRQCQGMCYSAPEVGIREGAGERWGNRPCSRRGGRIPLAHGPLLFLFHTS